VNLGGRWHGDPKLLGVTLARYKFVAKMLAGPKHVAEVGCGSGFQSRVVRQHVDYLEGVDIRATFAAPLQCDPYPVVVRHADILAGPLSISEGPRAGGRFDAIYSLDVLEHVTAEGQFMANLCASIVPAGVAIVGMPSLESQQWASPQSAAEHVNCKTADGLRELMEAHFQNVFMFGMNDEVLHTGFAPMCHYRLAIGAGVRLHHQVPR
jgi:2-polyprenyl-3-methyl-5-hydroxy-6-metoxy-1,4-benzoquinol methylase